MRAVDPSEAFSLGSCCGWLNTAVYNFVQQKQQTHCLDPPRSISTVTFQDNATLLEKASKAAEEASRYAKTAAEFAHQAWVTNGQGQQDFSARS